MECSKYCSLSWKEVIEDLDSDDIRGIKESEYLSRKEKYGDNKISLSNNNLIKTTIKSFIKIYLLISIIIFILSIFTNNLLLITISALALTINIGIKLYFICRANNNSSYLQKVNKATVVVIRDNIEKIIRADELVVGDIIVFKKGSLIGADVRIIEAKNLKVDERNITGEDFFKEKFESKIDGNIENIEEMKNILFKSSIIKEGHGYGVVVATGVNTQFGKLMRIISHSDINKYIIGNNLEKRMNVLMISFSAIIILIGYLLKERLNNIVIQLVMIESFPLGIILSLFLFLLVKRLREEKGIDLINYSTIELIKDVDCLFLDKIGSLTKNEMKVVSIYTNDLIYEDYQIDYNKDDNIKRIFDINILCNDAIYNIKEDDGKGDITEIAFLRYSAKHRVYKSIIDSKYKRVFQIPIDSDKMILTTVNKYKKGYRANVKGSVDSILDRCTHIMFDGNEREITEADKDKIRAIDYNFSVEGLISQGVAYRNFGYKPSTSENIESNLIFVGIVAFENPLIDNVNEELEKIKSIGVSPIIFTEDNRIAAVALGKKTGLINDIGGVISGVELEHLTKEELISVLKKVRIFSRVTPKLKGKIVAIYTKNKYKVAVTGENLGDIASLSLSQVGIGKGKVSEVVRRVSDIYISNNFLTGFLDMFRISKGYDELVPKIYKYIFNILLFQIALVNIMSLFNLNQFIKYLLIISLLILPLGISIFIELKMKKW